MRPTFWSVFSQSQQIVDLEEGPNDGLVSVASSKWGGDDGYKGTLLDVSHLDLINWVRCGVSPSGALNANEPCL